MIQHYYIATTKDGTEWLPTKVNRNATGVELTNTRPPRLFNSEQAAKQAIRWWQEGIHHMGYYPDAWSGPGGVDMVYEFIVEREKVELIIRKVTITY